MQLGEQLRQPLWFFSLPEKSIEVNKDLDIKIIESTDYLMVSNDSYTQGNSQDDGVYVVLKSEKECHVFPMRQRRNGIKRLFLQQQFYGQGFDSESILKEGLAIGKYKLGIIEVKNGQKSIKFTNKTFEIQQSLKWNEVSRL